MFGSMPIRKVTDECNEACMLSESGQWIQRAKAGSNPHTQATTTLISNKYMAYRWLLSFTLTSDTTSVIVRWSSMVESEHSNPAVSMDEVCMGMIASRLYCSVRSKKHEADGRG